MGIAPPHRLSVFRQSRDTPGNLGARTVPARFFNREQRSGLSENDGAAREISNQQKDYQLRPADGLFVQSGWIDDVLHLRDHVHRAGVQHPAWSGAADYNASPS